MQQDIHTTLIALEKELGYSGLNRNGLCLGFTIKWLEAVLCGHEAQKEFDDRLKKIQKYAEDLPTLHTEINKIRTKIKKKEPPTPEEKTILDIPALMDSIHIYHSSYDDTLYEIFTKELFQFQIEERSLFGASTEIDELSIQHSGAIVPDQQTLIQYFSNIGNLFSQQQKNAHIILGFNAHATALYYEYASQTWHYMDINEWPPISTKIIGDFVNILLPATTIPSSPVFVNFIQKKSLRLEDTSSDTLEQALQTIQQNNNQLLTSWIARQNSLTISNTLLGAIIYANLDIFQALLAAQGINPNQANYQKITPLEYAITLNKKTYITALLAHQQFDPNQLTSQDITPLEYAVNHNKLDIVQALLAHKDIKPDQENSKGMTPLLQAITTDHIDIVSILLKRDDIDPNQTTAYGITPLSFYINTNNSNMVKTLLNNPKINPNQPNKNGKTPLEQAISTQNTDIIQALLIHPKVIPNDQKQYNVSNLYKKIHAFENYLTDVYQHSQHKQDKENIQYAHKLNNIIKDNTLLILNGATDAQRKNIERQFSKVFHEAYGALKTHRAGWKPLLLNIAIAATGIGLVIIGAKLALTGTGFFSQTERQKKLRDIQHDISQINTPKT